MEKLSMPTVSVRTKVSEIAEFLLNFESLNKPISLQAGDIGVAIFLAEYGRYAGDEKYTDKAMDIVESAFDIVEQTPTSNTFCNGLSGMLWGVNYLIKNGLIEGDAEETLQGADDVVAFKMMGELRQKEYDYMHHGSGPILYFLERLSNPKSRDIIASAVDLLEAMAVKENGEVKWVHDPEYKLKSMQPRKCIYNLGLSHGIPSLVIILSLVYEAGIRQEKCTEMIEGAMKWMLTTELEPPHYSLYPTGVYEDGNTNSSRFGWCYGDLGVGLTFWHAARALNRSDWHDKSIEIFQHAAQRSIDNAPTLAINDAGFCHGAVGPEHIFFQMFQRTGLPEFKEAADFWLEKTLQFDHFEDGYCGYKAHRLEGYENTYTLLEGIAGIGSCLLARVNGGHAAWDRMFLIS